MLSKKRDAMVKEMKSLRDNTVPEWEEVLKEVPSLTAEYLNDIEKIDNQLITRAKELHRQVDAILFKSQQTLKQIRAAGLAKMKNQEKYLENRLQQLKKEVKKYERQLRDANQSALLQFQESKTENTKPPTLNMESVPLFNPGSNDTKAIERMIGQISKQDEDQRGTSKSDMPLTSSKLTKPSNVLNPLVPKDTKTTDKLIRQTTKRDNVREGTSMSKAFSTDSETKVSTDILGSIVPKTNGRFHEYRPTYTPAENQKDSFARTTSFTSSKTTNMSVFMEPLPAIPICKSSLIVNQSNSSLIPTPSVILKFETCSYFPHIACTKQGQAWVVTKDCESIQLVGRDGSINDSVEFDNRFIKDITLTSDGEILFADVIDQCIKSLSRQKKISTLFTTTESPIAIGCFNKNEIVVSLEYDRKVAVYDRIGKIKRTIEHVKIRHPKKLAVSKVNRDIYICDTLGDTYNAHLLAFGEDGQLRYEYSGQGDNDLSVGGLCTDHLGHILIADPKYHTVHILDINGRFLQYILTSEQGLDWPRSIDVDLEGYVWVGEQLHIGCVKVVKYLR